MSIKFKISLCSYFLASLHPEKIDLFSSRVAPHPYLLHWQGGFVDDFLSHLMCCCCALVQEWREVEIRGVYGPEKTKTSPPPSQFMES
ncbi:hypothetical protein OIU84_006134 [Salix udensis]|uniref:Uncharacterized protein n=1 Tax=Salix udensis TaxID=889485 RepID=A0AAD6P1T3_9ROSI|nr:hypothetical protein OIU84_006134 [Salix udensis]